MSEDDSDELLSRVLGRTLGIASLGMVGWIVLLSVIAATAAALIG